MRQNDAGHTGYTPGQFNPESFMLKWRRTIGNGRDLSIDDGRIFVPEGGTSSSLAVLDASTGQTLYTKMPTPQVAWYSETAVVDGIAYSTASSVALGATVVAGFNATTGEDLFLTNYISHADPTATIAAGSIYAKTSGSSLTSFNAVNGDYKWDVYAPGRLTVPAVGSHGTFVYSTASTSGNWTTPQLLRVNPSNGELTVVARNPHGFDMFDFNEAYTTVVGDRYAFGMTKGRIDAFDVVANRLLWEYRNDVNPDNVQGQPIYSNGFVYVNDGGYIVRLNAQTGEKAFASGFDHQLLNPQLPMVLTDSHIFACGGGRTYAINLSTRSVDWYIAGTGRLAISDNTLYITSPTRITAVALPEPASSLLSLCMLYPGRRRR